jgi:hypothetical protein
MEFYLQEIISEGIREIGFSTESEKNLFFADLDDGTALWLSAPIGKPYWCVSRLTAIFRCNS